MKIAFADLKDFKAECSACPMCIEGLIIRVQEVVEFRATSYHTQIMTYKVIITAKTSEVSKTPGDIMTCTLIVDRIEFAGDDFPGEREKRLKAVKRVDEAVAQLKHQLKTLPSGWNMDIRSGIYLESGEAEPVDHSSISDLL